FFMMIPKAKTVNITWLQNNLCSCWCFAIPQVERLIQSFNLGVESRRFSVVLRKVLSKPKE
ncbi:hypothetical protein, partial [Victivallis vadensis]|uniref:hypothetical protein n=1 Tax=Victivallis vadensis TaxID=172901 RepID=UPI0023FA146A